MLPDHNLSPPEEQDAQEEVNNQPAGQNPGTALLHEGGRNNYEMLDKQMKCLTKKMVSMDEVKSKKEYTLNLSLNSESSVDEVL